MAAPEGPPRIAQRFALVGSVAAALVHPGLEALDQCANAHCSLPHRQSATPALRYLKPLLDRRLRRPISRLIPISRIRQLRRRDLGHLRALGARQFIREVAEAVVDLMHHLGLVEGQIALAVALKNVAG